MTLTLSYMDDLSRVRITGSGLDPGYVKVERSIAGGPWETVRGGVSLEVVAGAISLDDYEFAAGAENRYRIVPAVNEQFDRPSDDQTWGEPWEVPPGVRSLVVDCWGAGGSPAPDEEASAGAGGGAWARSVLDVEPGETLRVRVGAATAGEDGNSSAVIRGTTLLVDAAGGGAPALPNLPGAGGSDVFPASIGQAVAAGGDGGDRESDTGAGGGGGGSGGPDGPGQPGGAGALDVGGAGGLGAGLGGPGGDTDADGGDGAAPGGGGGGQGAGGQPAMGAPGRVRLTTWAGAPEQESITVGLERVWLKSIRYPAANRPVRVMVADGEELLFPGRLGLHPVKGRATPVSVYDQRGTREYAVTIGVSTAEEAHTIELMLMVSETVLLHVPASSTVPGGYLAVGDVTRLRATPVAPYRWALQATVVSPPGPDVTPTTLTWGTVRRLYGGWAALVAAHPTWADVLSHVGDPDDPVEW